MWETIEEMILHTDQLVILAQGLCLESPEGKFKQNAAQTLDALHYIRARIQAMDPLTGGVEDIPQSDYLSDPHVQAKRRRDRPYPKEGEEEEEEEEEDMDIQQMLAETPSAGN